MRNDLFLKQIGTKITVARKAKKISVVKLSKLCQIDMSNLWFIEHGQKNLHVLTLKKIADVLGKDVKDFI